MKTIIIILFLFPCLLQAQISFQYDSNGNRTARILDVTKCSNPVTKTDSTVLAAADSALLQAINEQNNTPLVEEQSIINVYPNPASDKVVVSYTASCPKCVLRIFTIEARQVYEAKGINKETEIDVSNLKSGVYYLSITTEDGKRQGWKIVKN